MRSILFLLSAALLTACVSNAPVVSREITQLSRSTEIPPPRSPGIKHERLLGSAGTFTWKPVSFKENHHPLDFVATLGYAPNSLGQKTFLFSLQDSQNEFGEFPGVPGFTLDWMGFLAADEDNLAVTFGDGNEQFKISGSALNASTSYSLYIYTADCLTSCGGSGSWTLVSATPLGYPVNGALSASSPLQGGFMWMDSNDAFLFDLVH